MISSIAGLKRVFPLLIAGLLFFQGIPLSAQKSDRGLRRITPELMEDTSASSLPTK